MVSEYSDPRCPICGAAHASCGGPATLRYRPVGEWADPNDDPEPGTKAVAGPPEDKAIRPRENKGGGE